MKDILNLHVNNLNKVYLFIDSWKKLVWLVDKHKLTYFYF
jgi:hypothetical protein